ncbi:MAG: FAD-dependent oxidoreductase, partial [Solirubrobacterales bacterium]
YWSWTATGAGDRPQPVVSAFAGSAEALRRLQVEHGPESWLRSLQALRPELELQTDGVVLSTWNDDPWVGAAYSVSPGAELTGLIRAPAAGGRIEFAGEHTAGEFSGLMEGALRSGRDAARRILARS